MHDPADSQTPATDAPVDSSGPVPSDAESTSSIPLEAEKTEAISQEVAPEAPPAAVHDVQSDSFATTFPDLSTPTLPAPTRRRGIPASLWLLAVLIPYAIVATVALLYLVQQNPTRQQPHILENIPDQGLYEDFFDGRRRDVLPPLSKASEKQPPLKVIPPNDPLPADLTPLKLGETRRIGDLAVTPLEVTRQTLVYDYKDGQKQVTGEEALVLRLQIKNAGRLIFRPDDETFNRAFLEDGRVPVYTFLQCGTQRFYGAITDPTQARLSLPSCGPLVPGETRTMAVAAVRSADGKTSVTTVLDGKELFLWRVHLRRGKEEVTMTNGRKRSVWVTTVVPVSFTSADVKSELTK